MRWRITRCVLPSALEDLLNKAYTQQAGQLNNDELFCGVGNQLWDAVHLPPQAIYNVSYRLQCMSYNIREFLFQVLNNTEST